MDFLDNVVKSSNAIKDKIKNPLNSIKLSDPFGSRDSSSSAATSDAVSASNQAAIQASQQSNTSASASLSSTTSDGSDPVQQQQSNNNNDMNSQFAAIAADAQAVTQKTVEGAKNIGIFLFSMGVKAGQTVSQTANKVKQVVENTNLMADFTKEQQEFLREHGSSIQAGELPWQIYQDEEKRNEMREQILSLSQDKRNFVRSPPDNANFEFDAKQCYPIALSLLKEDPSLSKLRYELVPKLVNEDTFWKNYFFRIHMLKKMSDGVKSWSSSRSSSGEGPDVEVDATKSTASHIDALKQYQSPAAKNAAQASIDKQPSLDVDSKKLFEEADDLKSRLKELNIGSFDAGLDG